MTDIVQRLRATGGNGQGGQIKAEAADEIERLRAALLAAPPPRPSDEEYDAWWDNTRAAALQDSNR